MLAYTRERADWLAGLMLAGQAGGELDPALSPDALAHFCLLLAFGSSVLTTELHAVDQAEWSALLARVVSALSPVRTGSEERQGVNEGARESEVAHGRAQEPNGGAA